jgi:hypothetical protein
MPPPDKPKGDRLKETIRLLKELQRVGFPETDVGYKEVKRIMTQWVEDGEALSTVVTFPRHGRDAHLELPKRADKAASIRLKVVEVPENDESEE